MSQPTEIMVTFKKAPDYKLYPATGAYGGPTTDRNIVMHITVEHASIPSYQKLAVSEAGQINLQQPLETVAAADAERTLLCGIVMSPQTARAVGDWLMKNADLLLGDPH